MANYQGAKCKLCRREGTKLMLKGTRCHTKCALERNPRPPGQPKMQRGRPSEYSMRLREKQKMRRIAQIMERPFEVLMEKASKSPGKTGELLLRFLELRLDSIVCKLGLAPSIRSARQLVNHGHVLVNKRRVDIPSYRLCVGDEIKLAPSMAENIGVKASLEMGARRKSLPAYLEFNQSVLTGKVLRLPSREEMSFPVQESLIVEHYSK